MGWSDAGRPLLVHRLLTAQAVVESCNEIRMVAEAGELVRAHEMEDALVEDVLRTLANGGCAAPRLVAQALVDLFEDTHVRFFHEGDSEDLDHRSCEDTRAWDASKSVQDRLGTTIDPEAVSDISQGKQIVPGRS